MYIQKMNPLLVTIPHSGEEIPPEATWLNGLPASTLLSDVDRFVDKLYEPAIIKNAIPSVKTHWHRYAVDLNRLAEDVDKDSVVDSKNPSGSFKSGLHWVETMAGVRLMAKPISRQLHEALLHRCFYPFHENVEKFLQAFKSSGAQKTFQLDLHSMPSVGTANHRDPGERRKDIVVSDFNGKSCAQKYREFVVKVYESQGFSVAVNWPYVGGRLTQQYGKPEANQHAIQVELNRATYMDEVTKLKSSSFQSTSAKLCAALQEIHFRWADV